MASLKECPDALTHDVFRKMFDISELVNMDEYTRSKVLLKMTTERDLRNQIEYAKKEAIEEGRAEGLEEGRAEGRAEGMNIVIRQMAAKGMDLQQIADIVELSVEEVKAIAAQ
jgi:predicted transposase/invertase (TIGR01784 family)